MKKILLFFIVSLFISYSSAQTKKITDAWVVFKTHLDIGYTDRIEVVLKKYRVDMMDNALKVVELSRDRPPEQQFSWTLAGWPLMHVLGPLQDFSRKARIEKAVREGSITFHALPFTTHTETQDLEDLVRGLGFSTRLSHLYDRPLPISAKMTDVPGHSWVMPTLLAHAGVKFLQIGCNGVSAFMRLPSLFWWEGPDGSRILCNYTADYGSGLNPPADWPGKNYLVMEMTGDNHGPPSPADIERLREQASKDLPGVKVHFGTLDDFARALIAENPELPIVRGDMPDTWIHGWLSMPLEAKAARQFRALEPALDVLDTQLRAWGVTPTPLVQALAEAYEQSGLFSEHTFGPSAPKGGSWETGIAKRYIYGDEWKAAYARGAYKNYEAAFDDKRAFAYKAQKIINRELSDRLDLLAKSIKTNGKKMLIYNALPWKRSGVVEVAGEPGKFIFAKQVPANGYRIYPVDSPNVTVQPEQLVSNNFENTFYKATFDLTRGGITSLIDKKTGHELVDKSSPYLLGQFLHERFDKQKMLDFQDTYCRKGLTFNYFWWKGNLPKDTYYAKLTPTTWSFAIQHTLVADIATLTATNTLGLAKGIEIIFTLYRHQPIVDVEWRVTDKTADPIPEGGWLCFPFAVAQPQFLLGRLGGPIDPTKDIIAGANRYYFCLNTGLTITGQDGTGIGLYPMDSPCVSLDEPGLWKYSLDYIPKKPTVFVNLYNNEWNTNFPEWQSGSWSSRVRLWLNGKGASLAQTLIVPSWEARLPLLAATVEGTGGNLPQKQTGLSVSLPGVLITAFGQNPDGEGTLLRLWEQSGQSGECTVQLPAGMNVRTAQPVNLRGEKQGNTIEVKRGTFKVNLKKYAPSSYLLKN
jgi:alpha-mannosidase